MSHDERYVERVTVCVGDGWYEYHYYVTDEGRHAARAPDTPAGVLLELLPYARYDVLTNPALDLLCVEHPGLAAAVAAARDRR